MEKTESSRNLRDRRTLQKKRLSARNIFSAIDSQEDDNNDDQSEAKPSRRSQLSSARMDSLRRDVMGGKEGRRNRGMERAKSNPRLSVDSDDRAARKDKRAEMRRAQSNPRLLSNTGGDGLRRAGSRRRLGTSNSNRNLNGSFANLKMTDDNEDNTGRQNARFRAPRRTNSGVKLNASLTGLSFDHTGDDDDDDRPILTKRQSSQRALALGMKF